MPLDSPVTFALTAVEVDPETEAGVAAISLTEVYEAEVEYWNLTVASALFALTWPFKVAPVVVIFVAAPIVADGALTITGGGVVEEVGDT